MGVFDGTIKLINSIEKSIPSIIKDVIKEFDKELINYNVEQQLYNKGEDKEGEKITPSYTRFTISIKKRKNQPTNRVTLKDTGSFHESIYIIAESDSFKIGTNHELSNDLSSKYGKNIIGIQDKYLKEFVYNRLIPRIKKRINDKLTKGR